MNKYELIETMANELEYSKADTERWLNAFIDTVTTNMKKGDGVKIIGFGTWKTAKRKARVGRNPQTGQEVKIPARTVPVFRPGNELKNWINGNKK